MNRINHRSSECDSVKTADQRKGILAKKKLCVNCTEAAHRASECRSTTTCKKCGKKHHTSICGEISLPKPVLTAHGEEDQQVIYPTVLVAIDGIQTHALLDTGAGSSYASAKLIEALHKKPKQVKTRRVDIMLSSTTTKVEIYTAKLTLIDGKFNKEIELSKVHKPQLMMVKNPKFKGLCGQYNHLEGINVGEDPENRDQIPVHVVLGARLKKNELYEEYDAIIQEQLQQGVVEPAPEAPSGKEFCIPHKAVVKKEAESTKLRIVYDASAREDNAKPSLNDCLHPGPSLQNQLWDILVKSRFNPVLLTSDLKKAFLQIRIKQEERHSLRFHWKEPNSDEIKIYRFTRALFGLTSSPFLLAGVLRQQLDSWEQRCPDLVKELRDYLYVDDLMTGGITVDEAREKKFVATKVFEDATFPIHKWHSNAKELEGDSLSSSESEDVQEL